MDPLQGSKIPWRERACHYRIKKPQIPHKISAHVFSGEFEAL